MLCDFESMNYLLRLRNLFLLILALLSIVRFGRRTLIPKSPPQKVLIIQTAQLGDMICMTPVFHALKRHIPEVKVYVAGNTSNKELLAGNNDVDEYITFDGKRIFPFIARLAREHIDVVCIRGFGFTSLVSALLAGIPTIIAPKAAEGKTLQTRMYQMLLHYVITVEYFFGKYMPRQFLRLLEPLSIYSDDTKKHLGFSDAALQKINQLFLQKGIDVKNDFVVGISPSAGNKVKEWPTQNFSRLADHINKTQGAKIFLIAGSGDSKEAEAMKASLNPRTKIIDFAGLLNIDELKACMAQLNLFISVDTGPIYIAEAFGTPTIDITGPIDEKEQPPIGKYHVVIVPTERKAPELFVMNARDYNYREARRQIESITVEMVAQEFDALYPLIASKHEL